MLVLLVWTYTHYNIRHNCFFKYNAEKYANICKICDYLRKNVCESILAFHAKIGTNTTSYFFRVGKLKTFNIKQS